MQKVLLIEDDALISKMYKQVFEFEGFEVHTANDGLDGIAQAEAILPDIIFCDVMMPKMNGLEVLETLKSNEKTKDTMVVMLTNMSGTQDSQRAMNLGAFAYIVKSEYKPKEIVDMAKKFLSHQVRGEN